MKRRSKNAGGSLKTDNLIEKLRSIFKIEQFRPPQAEVIQAVLSGKSALMVSPTGSGKSLCYQLPAAVSDRPVLVISPLIALMDDQVRGARSLGLRAQALHSGLSSEQRAQNLDSFAKGRLQLLYVTPERFKKEEFLEVAKSVPLSLLAVDEAHCISQWGHDFRPDYSRIGEFRELLGNPPTLALTATATPQVQQDILVSLRLTHGAESFVTGFARSNLALNVHEVMGWDEKIRAIVGLRHQQEGPAIVYFSLIQSLQKASQELARLGLRHLVYHGDLPAQVRRDQQKEFYGSDSALLLATPAFGLGVDKANIRLLIHAEISGSIESYYQEVGRAGRDGLMSQAHMLFDQDDVPIQMEFIKWANPDPEFVRRVFYLIKDNALRVQQEGVDFLREQMNFYNRRDFRVETSINILEREGCLKIDEERAKGRGFRWTAVQAPGPDFLSNAAVEARLKTQNQKLLGVLQFAQMESGCRMQAVLDYFGETGSGECGICDLCNNRRLLPLPLP